VLITVDEIDEQLAIEGAPGPTEVAPQAQRGREADDVALIEGLAVGREAHVVLGEIAPAQTHGPGSDPACVPGVAALQVKSCGPCASQVELDPVHEDARIG